VVTNVYNKQKLASSMAKEQEHKVAEYLRKYIKQGYKKEDVKKALDKAGYSKNIITNSVNNLKENSSLNHIKLFPKWYVITSLLLIIILTLSIILYFKMPVDCSFDKKCFIENALEGKNVAVKEDIAGSTLEYKYKNNIITKEFVKFSKDEPEEVIVLLKNKKIRCETNFKEELIDGVFGGIENCEGELLDIIYELKIIS